MFRKSEQGELRTAAVLTYSQAAASRITSYGGLGTVWTFRSSMSGKGKILFSSSESIPNLGLI
jgi:hypothetical protein